MSSPAQPTNALVAGCGSSTSTTSTIKADEASEAHPFPLIHIKDHIPAAYASSPTGMVVLLAVVVNNGFDSVVTLDPPGPIH